MRHPILTCSSSSQNSLASPSGEYIYASRQAIGAIGVGVDLLLYSQGDFDQRRDWWTSPAYWAAREGKVLHDPEH